MTSKKIDQFLIAVGALLVIISSYQLFFVRLIGDEGINLAVLERTQSVVKVKSTLSLDWRDAFSGFDLHEKQLLYTDKGSTAEIKFLKGNRISISENSLIKLTSLNEGEGVKIERGFIQAKILEDKPLRIELNGSELVLIGKNADVQINLHEGKGEIGIIKGDISVEKNGQVHSLDKTSRLELNDNKIEKKLVSFSTTKPLPGQILYTLNEKERVEFAWEPQAEGQLIISDNPKFNRPKKIKGFGSSVLDLKPGTFYWKVQDSNGSSLTGDFHLIKEVPLQILRPLSGEELKLAGSASKAAEVFLQWKGNPNDNYIVEWKTDKINVQEVESSGLLIPVSKTGIVEWRVKLQQVERKLAPWSSWQKVNVEIIDPPILPVKLQPEEIELQSYSNEDNKITLSWEASLKQTKELEISSPKGEIRNIEVSDNLYSLKLEDIGVYKWRVRARDELLRESSWSEWETFSLVDLSQETNAEGVQRIVLKKPDQLVSFSWKSDSNSQAVFELSEDKTFQTIIVKKEVSESEVKIVIPKTGNYFWRSRQYNTDGSFQVSKPVKVIIEPAPAPEKPEKLQDLEVPLEWKETSRKSSWWNAFISTAYADDYKIVAKIKMPQNEDAKKYAIRIYRDALGKDLIVEKIVEGEYFDWEQATPGKFYWQYALIDYWGRQSPFSDLSALIVTELAVAPPEKPRLINPISAKEIKKELFEIIWTGSKENKKYLLEVSKSKDFKDIVFKKNTTESQIKMNQSQLDAGLYFWRVTASNDSVKEVTSNTGRFVIKLPPVERTAIIDLPESWIKKYSKRFSFSWAPSSDSYEFKDNGTKGKIDGSTINSFEARGIYFTDKIIYSADLLRQSGKVFEEENYLFQRLQFHGTWKKVIGNHLWGPGLSIGTASGYSYEVNNKKVNSTAAGGFIYGPHVQGFYSYSPIWELQGRASYMLGSIPHMEFVGEANRKVKNFFLVLGLGYSMRDYSKGSGTQSSLRMNVGLGKEF